MYFETKVKYTKQMEDGSFKLVNEPYVLDTETFGSAEEGIMKALDHIKGELHVTAIKKLDITDVVETEAEFYYLCAAKYVDTDDKKRTIKILLRSNSVLEADKGFRQYLDSRGILQPEITGVTLSPVVESFEITHEK